MRNYNLNAQPKAWKNWSLYLHNINNATVSLFNYVNTYNPYFQKTDKTVLTDLRFHEYFIIKDRKTISFIDGVEKEFYPGTFAIKNLRSTIEVTDPGEDEGPDFKEYLFISGALLSLWKLLGRKFVYQEDLNDTLLENSLFAVIPYNYRYTFAKPFSELQTKATTIYAFTANPNLEIHIGAVQNTVPWMNDQPAVPFLVSRDNNAYEDVLCDIKYQVNDEIARGENSDLATVGFHYSIDVTNDDFNSGFFQNVYLNLI